MSSLFSKEEELEISERWDGQNDGYAPIYLVDPQIMLTLTPRKRQTAVSALTVLHYPALTSHGTRTGLELNEESRCMKLDAIIEMLYHIRNKKCNLDLAIVTSCKDLEEVIAARLSGYDFQFKTLTDFHDKKKTPVFGVLVRFRKRPNLTPHFRMRVDFAIFYDSSLMEIRPNIIKHFRGVYYNIPQSVAFTYVSTCDNRICNYRDKHPYMTISPDDDIRDLSPVEQALFVNQEHVITYKSRTIHNNYIIKRLVDWMVLKDGSPFKPIDFASYEHAFGENEVPPILGDRSLLQSPPQQPLHIINNVADSSSISDISKLPESLKRRLNFPKETTTSKRSKDGTRTSKSVGSLVLPGEVSMLSQSSSTLDNRYNGSSRSNPSDMGLQTSAPVSDVSSRVLEDLNVKTPPDFASLNTPVATSVEQQQSHASPYQVNDKLPHPTVSSSSSISSSTTYDQSTQGKTWLIDDSQNNTDGSVTIENDTLSNVEVTQKGEQNSNIYNGFDDFERALENAHLELIRALNGD